MVENRQEMVKFGTIQAWAKEFGIPVTVMTERLSGVEGIDGRQADGKVLRKGFY